MPKNRTYVRLRHWNCWDLRNDRGFGCLKTKKSLRFCEPLLLRLHGTVNVCNFSPSLSCEQRPISQKAKLKQRVVAYSSDRLLLLESFVKVPKFSSKFAFAEVCCPKFFALNYVVVYWVISRSKVSNFNPNFRIPKPESSPFAVKTTLVNTSFRKK